ncbi:MAG: hypothetical protein JJU29_08840 [Verrucomicrobia bacterium]|nr:hypothetical protein [Verrucomicrobiota bacterium]
MQTTLPAFAETDLLRQNQPITYKQFRELVSYPTWNYLTQVIRTARAYDEGLSAGIHLLNMNEEYKENLTQEEYDNHLRLLYHLCLDMLDKLDRWQDFLDTFSQVWLDKRFVYRCHKKQLDGEFGELMAKGVVSETPHYVYLHEFWPHVFRKEVIERKIKRQAKGCKMGNMYHHTKDDLTPEEISYRRKWLYDLIHEFNKRKKEDQKH